MISFADLVLVQVDVMVTSGANQAFVNVVLTLTDANDSVVLFTPLYFNHRMALQMTGGGRSIMYGPPTEGLKPDLDWLEEAMKSDSPPRMVVIVNPCNPAGAHRFPLSCRIQSSADSWSAAQLPPRHSCLALVPYEADCTATAWL